MMLKSSRAETREVEVSLRFSEKEKPHVYRHKPVPYSFVPPPKQVDLASARWSGHFSTEQCDVSIHAVL